MKIKFELSEEANDLLYVLKDVIAEQIIKGFEPALGSLRVYAVSVAHTALSAVKAVQELRDKGFITDFIFDKGRIDIMMYGYFKTKDLLLLVSTKSRRQPDVGGICWIRCGERGLRTSRDIVPPASSALNKLIKRMMSDDVRSERLKHGCQEMQKSDTKLTKTQCYRIIAAILNENVNLINIIALATIKTIPAHTYINLSELYKEEFSSCID